MVPSWSKTAHASIFTNVINGTAIAGYTESACMCPLPHGWLRRQFHRQRRRTSSSWPAQLGWTFPGHRPARQFRRPCRQLAERGQHPVRELPWTRQRARQLRRRTSIAISVPTNTGACSQCHDEPSHHIKSAAWANSMHAVTTTDPAGNATCVGCHTGTGFIARMSGATITDTTYHSIDCYTCHEPHGLTAPANDSHLIRNMASATLADGTKVTTAGEGILCMQCHQARHECRNLRATHGGKLPLWPARRPAGRHADGHQRLHLRPADSQLRAPVRGHQHLHRLPHADRGLHRSGVPECRRPHLQHHLRSRRKTGRGSGGRLPDLPWAGHHQRSTSRCSTTMATARSTACRPKCRELLDQLSTMLPPNNSVKTSLSIDSTWTEAAVGSGLQLAVRDQRRQQGNPQYGLRGGPAARPPSPTCKANK